ncbi:MAG: type II toxin-antitoxin system VapC family toxin [Alphaproteobacteria bacterium]|jgi:toxin FitB|nr:MAG: type II toxin-antitoxin system VapC family toxin [Alphaproteobacteria bacterium]
MPKMLIDTCVLSELYKAQPLDSVVTAFEALHDNDIYLSVITMGELRKGISLLPQGKRQSDLLGWFDGMCQQFRLQILSIDSMIACLWGEITALAQKNGVSLPIADGLIAATALHHGLTIMTRNVKDFSATPVSLYNPWE